MGAHRGPPPYIVPPGAGAWMYGELTRSLSPAILAIGCRHRDGDDHQRSRTQENDRLTSKDLEASFENGWNRHDVDVLMSFMSPDCVFESSAGPQICGTRHAGPERVREAFAGVFRKFPDAASRDARHFVAGSRGVSEWIFTGTTAEGTRIEGDKIAVKSSYFKTRTARD